MTTIVKAKRSAQRLLWVIHINEISATFHEMKRISNVSYRSLTFRGYSKFDEEHKTDERGALHPKSVDTEFDFRDPVNEDDVNHFQRHDTLHMSVFTGIAFKGVCRKRWSKNTRSDSMKKCVSICFYSKKWRRPNVWSKRVFPHVRTQRFCGKTKLWRYWRDTFVLFFSPLKRVFFLTRYQIQYVLHVER